MLEQLWSKIWYRMLDDIAISYETTQPAAIKFIELAKDCISLYSDEQLFLLPSSDNSKVKVDTRSLQMFAELYKKNKEPSGRELRPVIFKSQIPGNVIKCKGNDLKDYNVIRPWNFRHSIWHVNDKMESNSHQHYIPHDEGLIKKEGITCLLGKFEFFNSILNTTIINPKDIDAITQEYEKQHLAMKQNAKILGRESAKSFLFLVLTNFILDFSGRYLMPLMLYQSPDEISKHKDILLNLGRIIQPLFIIINQFLNYDILLSRLLISVSGMIAQYAGIKWLPNEFFRFMNIAKLLLTAEIDENVAKEVGFDVAALLGSTSAKALGSLLSNCLIHELPKLKQEPSEAYDLQLMSVKGDTLPTIDELSTHKKMPLLMKCNGDFYVYGISKAGKPHIVKLDGNPELNKLEFRDNLKIYISSTENSEIYKEIISKKGHTPSKNSENDINSTIPAVIKNDENTGLRQRKL